MFRASRCFESVDDCFQFVLQTFFGTEWTSTMSPSGLFCPHLAPKYLFRGENGLHDTTLSSLARFMAQPKWNKGERDHLMEIGEQLNWRFMQDDFQLSSSDATAILQHYSFPSAVIDFTASISVAFSFACKKPGRARLAVLGDLRRGPIYVRNYTNHWWAERPRRQQAFGIVPRGFQDLKSDHARSSLSLRWFEFPVTAADVLKWENETLLSLGDDPVAGLLRRQITEYVEAQGKIPDGLALHLVDSVPMVPCFQRVEYLDESRQEVVTRFVAPDIPFEKAVERLCSYHYWSADYPHTTAHHYPFEAPRAPGTIFASPATLHVDP